MPNAKAAGEAALYLEECLANRNSSGGTVECVVTGLPVGLGDPVFEKLDANLAKAIFSIGAVKGFEIGDGFKVSSATGLTNNDAFGIKDGKVTKETNHSGGTLGGMSDGSPLVFRAAIKPTPSIASTQHTINQAKEEIDTANTYPMFYPDCYKCFQNDNHQRKNELLSSYFRLCHYILHQNML